MCHLLGLSRLCCSTKHKSFYSVLQLITRALLILSNWAKVTLALVCTLTYIVCCILGLDFILRRIKADNNSNNKKWVTIQIFTESFVSNLCFLSLSFTTSSGLFHRLIISHVIIQLNATNNSSEMLMTVYFYKEFIKNMWHTYVSYICRSNPVFIRQHARFIMSANENARVSNRGYSAFTACVFFSPQVTFHHHLG